MKKLIAIGIAVLFVLGVSVSAYALSANENVGVTLNVNAMFSMIVVDDEGDQLIELGLLNEGDTSGSNLTMYCSTNQGNPWSLQVKGEDLTNTGATLSIPVSSITFSTFAAGDEAGVGAVVGATPMTTADQLAYTADATEYSDTDVRVSMAVSVLVPYGTTEDYYGGDLTITMTE